MKDKKFIDKDKRNKERKKKNKWRYNLAFDPKLVFGPKLACAILDKTFLVFMR